MQRFLIYLKRNAIWFGVMAAIAAYVVIAGKSGTCPACVAITQAAGIVPSPKALNPDAYDRLDVGDTIPPGQLTAGDGAAVDIERMLSEAPAVLVFYRGGWCPFCNRHLAAIVDIIPELEKLGVKLIAVSPDSPEKLHAKPKLADLPYQLLSDSPMQWTSQLGIAFQVPDELVSKYLKSYSIDLEADSGYSHHLLPHPAVFVVDSDRVIRFAHVNENYKVRLEPERILEAAKLVVK